MNYYPHHIGDYAAATVHLSWLEDMAYTRLIRIYYQTEKPIPSDKERVYRLARATSKQERAAIDAVLSEFFTLTDEEGYRQRRCDEEIAKAKESTEENEAKKRNERERQERYRKRRREVFEALREYDCVPKWDTPMDELEALLSRHQTQASNGPVTRDSTLQSHDQPRLTNSQEPITNNQEPTTKPLPTTSGASPPSLWGAGLAVLTSKGVEDKAAREMLGKLRKEYGDDLVLSACLDAQKQDVSDPIPWLTKACKARKTGLTKPRSTEPDFSKVDYRAGVSADGRF